VPYPPAVVIDLTARRSPGLGFAGCSRLAASSGFAAALLLCVAALAGCTSEEQPRVQYVAFCQGSSSDNAQGNPVQVEFRQGSTVVATGSMSVGVAFTAEVPIGGIQIYVDDVEVGAVNEGVDAEAFPGSPEPDDASYLATGEGCPKSPPPGVPSG
jgi:hypothetical protein